MAKKKRKRLLPFFAVIITGLVLLIAIGITTKHRNRMNVPVSIPRGSSISRIAYLLDSSDVISNRYLFIADAVISGKLSRMQSGVYKFPEALTLNQVLEILAVGSHQVAAWITIPEGTTIRGMAAIIAAKSTIPVDSFIAHTKDKKLIESLNIGSLSLEGYLMPDTYLIRFDESPAKVIRRMASALKKVLTPEIRARIRERKTTIHAVLTMASIVEGETNDASERARVAGVYYNRLKRGMLLQADPTIQYIIRDGPRRLYYKDLAIESPYNTYRHKGLPPGPISNPGKEAIMAALYPESHSFLYFVADGKGHHRFSRTAAEHQLAVNEYRKSQK